MTQREDDHSDDEALEELVFDALERLERDGSPELEAVIASAAESRPDLEPQLRRRISALRQVGLFESEEPVYLEIPRQLGAFAILRPIGEGGMGVVVEAHDSALDRSAALKLIRPEFVDEPTIRRRFHREVQAVAQLQHPGIVRVFDVGEESGVPYLAMELIDGCTLSAAIDGLGNRDVEDLSGRDLFDFVSGGAPGPCPPFFDGPWHVVCARICRDVAEALAHAHAAGVQHRDIKASNIMMTPLGRIVVLDFGLAHVAGSAALTRTGAVLGSLPYTAPELIAAAPGVRRVSAAEGGELGDVYSLGVVLYELLTLRLPFRGKSSAELMEAVLQRAPEPLRTVNSSVPFSLARVTERAVRRDPRRRIPSAAALAQSLSSVLEGRTPRPYGDGALAALGSRWRARPFTTSALAASALIAAFLPLMWLRYELVEASATARSGARSVASLRTALAATDELQRLLPRSPEIQGTQLDRLRLGLTAGLVQLRTAVAEDERLDVLGGDLRALAQVGCAEALLELGQSDRAQDILTEIFGRPELIDAVRSRATVAKARLAPSEAAARALLEEAAEAVTDPWPRARLIATIGSLAHAAPTAMLDAARVLRDVVQSGVAPTPDLALVRAAHLELNAGSSSYESLEAAAAPLLRSAPSSAYPLEVGLMLARLESEIGRLQASQGRADLARASRESSVSRIASLAAALPESAGLVAELARRRAEAAASPDATEEGKR